MRVAVVRGLRIAATAGMGAAGLFGVLAVVDLLEVVGNNGPAGAGVLINRKAFAQFVIQPFLVALTPFVASGLLYVGCEIALHLNQTLARPEPD